MMMMPPMLDMVDGVPMFFAGPPPGHGPGHGLGVGPIIAPMPMHMAMHQLAAPVSGNMTLPPAPVSSIGFSMPIAVHHPSQFQSGHEIKREVQAEQESDLESDPNSEAEPEAEPEADAKLYVEVENESENEKMQTITELHSQVESSVENQPHTWPEQVSSSSATYYTVEIKSENPESDDFSPIQDRDGNVMLEIDCGSNSALLYVNKLCQGSKGQCIMFEGQWYTPNEFQFISGRETAKDWKRSIRHRGKSLKILMGRGLLRAHPLMCECDTCRQNFALKGGLRLGDRRVPVPSSACNANGSLVAVDRSRMRRNGGPDGEGAHLNDIIDQLQHGNNNGYANGRHHHHTYEAGRKRSLGVDNGSPNNLSPTSMSATCGLALVKRPRSISPREDDIYDEQQRKIFEAANSPEPQNIENLRRSLNLSSSRSNSPSGGSSPNSNQGGPQVSYGGIGSGSSRGAPMIATVSATINGSLSSSAGPADLSRHRLTASPPSGASVGSSGLVLMSQPPQMISSKHQTKSRKQTAPQHIDVGGNREEAHNHRSSHIVLSSYSGQPYHKANAAIRPRYQSTPTFNNRNSGGSNSSHGATQQHSLGSSGELNLSTNGNSTSRRSHSSMNPTVRPPGTPVKMIELTRPEIVPSSGSGYNGNSRPSSAHSSTNLGEEASLHIPGNSSIGNGDAIFLPEDMTSWTVSDVTHFVQSLKGCEEYNTVFREQAIDGEILPVLTEDHLLHNMGLKLGPALKIRLHVARRLGFTLDGQYCNTTAAPSSSLPPPGTPQQLQPQPQPQPSPALPPTQPTAKQQSDTPPAPMQSTTPAPSGNRPSTPGSSQKSTTKGPVDESH